MGVSTQSGKTITQSWGLGGQLLVLFLHDHNTQNSTQNYIPTKPKSSPFPSSSSPSSSTITGRAQITISICFFLLLISLSLFAISSFDSSPKTHQISLPRRWLAQNKHRPNSLTKSHNQNFALQGMGTIFHRGNRAMTELLVAHLDDSTRPDDLRWFVRALLRSGLVSKSDVVLIFPQLTPHLKSIILEENQLFSRFLARHSFPNRTHDSGASFNATHLSKKPRTEPLWGRGGGKKGDDEAELSRGSLVGFDSTELDPEDSLGGFIENAPIQFRRWACYRMLLGRLRRSFKHVVFVGVKDSWVAGDVFGRVRNRKTGDTVWVSDHVIFGGIRAVRRLSDAMLTEIVRVLIGRKNRAPQQESQILNHLLKNNNSALSKKIKVSFTAEILPTNSILSSSNSSLFAALQKAICDSSVDSDSSVYRDC